MKRIVASDAHPCRKRTVTATICALDGTEFVATNQCRVDGACPREHLPTGVGYELCNPVHAEVRAIQLAGDAARGGTLYLAGHTYACGPCHAAALAAGISDIIVLEAAE